MSLLGEKCVIPQFQAHTPRNAAILGRSLCGLEARVADERAQKLRHYKNVEFLIDGQDEP
jgi:hypothetical protein